MVLMKVPRPLMTQIGFSNLGLVASVTLALAGIGVVGCHTTDIRCIMQTTAITRGRVRLSVPVRFTPSGIPSQIQSPVTYIYMTIIVPVGSPYQTTMNGCTLRFSRNSPLRTTLVDETTGQARYRIDTPRKVARSVTRISKFDPSVQPPLHRDEDADPNPGDDITNKGKKRGKPNSKKGKKDGEEVRDEMETELPGTGDEIARIYWKWFSSHKIVFRGGITTQSHFLPKAGKMRG